MLSHWLMSLYHSDIYVTSVLRVSIFVALLAFIWTAVNELRYDNRARDAFGLGFYGFIVGGFGVWALAAILPVAFSGLLWAFFL